MHVALLSPHRDDAAFSCGLSLCNLLEAGNKVTIVNVCTVSRYAPYLSQACGDLPRQITDTRRNEDSAFVEALLSTSGARNGRVELVDFEWQDVPLRWRMEDRQALASITLPRREVQALANLLCALPPSDIVLVPMALGGHIDHRLVRQAAVQAFPASALVFYEDLPYACRMSASERKSFITDLDESFSSAWLPLQEMSNGLKRRYALCYPSQIAVDVADEMEIYAAEHGGKEYFAAGPAGMRMLTSAMTYKDVL